MAKMHKVDIALLGRRTRALRKDLGRLTLDRDLLELLRIIRRPGWTTPAEFLFASGIVESMIQHTHALEHLGNALMSGSRTVSKA